MDPESLHLKYNTSTYSTHQQVYNHPILPFKRILHNIIYNLHVLYSGCIVGGYCTVHDIDLENKLLVYTK